MAIRRVGAKRKRYATRTANPRKRRVTRRKRPVARRKRRANPRKRRTTKRGMVRRTARRAYRPNPTKRRRRRSSKGMLMVAGVDMGLVALGTVSAVLIKNGISAIPGVGGLVSNLPKGLQPFASPAIVIGAGWAIHKYSKNPTLKKVGAYAAVAALVLAVDDFAGQQLKGVFGGAYHNYGGAYHQYGGTSALSGMHLDVGTGGAYVQLPNPVHTGASSSMFGGITNLA